MIKIPNLFKLLVIFQVSLTAYGRSLYINRTINDNCLMSLALPYDLRTASIPFNKYNCREEHSKMADLLTKMISNAVETKKDKSIRSLLDYYWNETSNVVNDYFLSFKTKVNNSNPQLENPRLLKILEDKLSKIYQNISSTLQPYRTQGITDQVGSNSKIFNVREHYNNSVKDALDGFLEGIKRIMNNFNKEVIQKKSLIDISTTIDIFANSINEFTNLAFNLLNQMLNKIRPSTTTTTELPTTTTTTPTTSTTTTTKTKTTAKKKTTTKKPTTTTMTSTPTTTTTTTTTPTTSTSTTPITSTSTTTNKKTAAKKKTTTTSTTTTTEIPTTTSTTTTTEIPTTTSTTTTTEIPTTTSTTTTTEIPTTTSTTTTTEIPTTTSTTTTTTTSTTTTTEIPTTTSTTSTTTTPTTKNDLEKGDPNQKRNAEVDDKKTNMKVWQIVIGCIFGVLAVIGVVVIGVWQYCFKNKFHSYYLDNKKLRHHSNHPLIFENERANENVQLLGYTRT